MGFMRRVAAATLAGLLSVAALPMAAHADGGSMWIDPETFAAGDRPTVSGTGCVSSYEATVLVSVNGLIEAVTPDASGDWSFSFEVGDDDELIIRAVCDTYEDAWEYEPLEFEVSENEAVEPEGVILDAVRNGCKVTISTEVAGGARYDLLVWDDGQVIDEFGWDESGAKDVVWTITRPAGTQAAGVDFVLLVDGKIADFISNWEFPAAAANECSAAVPVSLRILDYDSSTVAGATHSVVGKGYLPGERVELVLATADSDDPGVTVAVLLADGEGRITGSFVVPKQFQPATYVLIATGEQSGRRAAVTVKVVSGSPSPGSHRPGMSKTGV